MKRCPECRRDYYDDTLLYCLDDGNALLEGPASMDEPPTAILHSTAAPGEAPTRAQIQITDQTAILPSGTGDVVLKTRGFDKRLLFAPLALAVIVLGGFFGYRYITLAKQIESIAVMPFVNESGNADVEYLSDGMTETLISSLSQLPNLSVKARSSVFRYKGRETDPKTIGKELNVQAILNGRVTQRGDQLTLSLELIDAQTENVIWSDKYDRKQADLVTLQTEIARDVSSKLKSKLSGSDEAKVGKNYTANPEAYKLYLKGRFYLNKTTAESLKKGIEYFQQAIDKDPNYALAYTGIADCYSLLGVSLTAGSLSPSEAIPKAKAAAVKALEMDDTLAEAHTSLAIISFNYNWDWLGAEREFKRAIELNPNNDNAHHWYSHYLMAMGRTEESLSESKRALEIDQLGLLINLHLGWHYMNARQYDLAIEQFRRTLELDPNYGMAHWYLGQAYEQYAKYPEAVEELGKAKDLLKENVGPAAELGRAYAASGKGDDAQKVIDELKQWSREQYVSSFHMALIYAAMDDKVRALDSLESAYQERSDFLVYLKVDPRLDTLRSDPRFKDLLKRMNLPE